MDIDEMELRLLKAYDEIRAQNTQIEEETTALGEETKEAIDSIERDMSSYINDMQQQMNQLMSDLKRDMTAQAEEFRIDMRALETGDQTERELKDELKTLKQGFKTEVSDIRRQLTSAFQILEASAEVKLSGLRERSEEELTVALDDILANARALTPEDLEEKRQVKEDADFRPEFQMTEEVQTESAVPAEDKAGPAETEDSCEGNKEEAADAE